MYTASGNTKGFPADMEGFFAHQFLFHFPLSTSFSQAWSKTVFSVLHKHNALWLADFNL